MPRILLAILVGLVAVDCSDEPRAPSTQPASVPGTEISMANGGVATSLDGNFSVVVPAGSYSEDITVTIATHPPWAPSVMLSSAYVVTVAPATATPTGSPLPEVVFDLAVGDLPGSGSSSVRVAHGGIAGQPWDDLLAGWYDPAEQTFRAPSNTLSYFVLLDFTAALSCDCDTGAGCQPGCEFCDYACQNGATDCATAGCAAGEVCIDGACVALCVANSDCTGGCCTSNGLCANFSCQSTCACDVSASCDPGCPCDPDANPSGTSEILRIINWSPASGSMCVAVDTSIYATFSADLDPTTITANTFYLEDSQVRVPGTVSYDQATFTAQFQPTSPLAFESLYSITVSPGVCSLDVGSLPLDLTSSFQTVARTGCTPGVECQLSSDCPGTMICSSIGICINECVTDQDCLMGTCVSGSCTP